jgi:tetratricopeptide (TPR) repeat protein
MPMPSRSEELRSQLGRIEEAIEDFDKAIELNPKLGSAHFFRGCIKFSITR